MIDRKNKMPEIIKPYFNIEDEIDGERMLKNIERYSRTCYKSEKEITCDSAVKFVKMIMKKGHKSVIEHEKITVRVICDRGVSHEIVRHRIGSYSQESTRYCDYSKKWSIAVIEPFFFEKESEKYAVWLEVVEIAEELYNKLRELGASFQEARSVLPNSLKTEIVITYNLREWCHFFKLRTPANAHPQMGEIAIPLLREFQKRIPIIFDDIIVP
jgi:thymidylate synthase (FAD)